jgi:MFS family permease
LLAGCFHIQMISTLSSFPSLYLATLLMLVSTGLFNTYIALKLSAESVSAFWIGTLISAYYLGLVFGARIGHRLIIRVGHVRACATAAILSICAVLSQSLFDSLPIWIGLRLIVGVAMSVQYIVVESWLNEQTENSHRGRVMSVYMVMSGSGTALGQLAITLYPTLDLRPLIFVALCQALSLLPIVLTQRKLPIPQPPAPIDFPYFFKAAPQALFTVFLAGNISASFYGLAAVFAFGQGLSTPQIALYTATSVIAGLMAQWPMGWLSDRTDRAKLIRNNAVIFTVLAVLMWGWMSWPYWVMLIFAAGFGVIQFTFYTLASNLANDRVNAEKRVGLAAVVLMTYGVGATIGPMIAGALMRAGGPSMLYVFSSVCALILVLLMWRPKWTR